jgi:hypothetical protein
MTIRERPNLEFRMTRMLIAAITAVCMASSANAAMNRIEKGQQLKKLHKMYLQGVRDGLLAYNRQLETDTSRRGGGKPYFCLPVAFRVIRNGPRHFIMDRLASGDVTRSPADIQGLAMRPVATMRLRLLDLIEKRAFYVERTIHRTTDWTFLAGKPVYELVSPKGQVYVMQSYSQIVDPSLAYADLAALGSRLKPPNGWQYRSRTLTADLVAPARGEAHIIQDELQSTYQRLPGP